jgi:hypothetical protein
LLTGIPNAAIPESDADAFYQMAKRTEISFPTNGSSLARKACTAVCPPQMLQKLGTAPSMKPRRSIRRALKGMLRSDLAVPGDPDLAYDALSLVAVVLEPIVTNGARCRHFGFERRSKKALVKFCFIRERYRQPFS